MVGQEASGLPNRALSAICVQRQEGRPSSPFEHLFYAARMREPPFHVWVDVTGAWASPAAGILLAWRRTGRSGWEAWVICASSHSTGSGAEVSVSQSWVLAHHVRPADAPRPEADLSGYRRAGTPRGR